SDADRPARSATLSDLRASFDQSTEIPASVRLLCCDDPRTSDANLADRRTFAEQFADAVADRDRVDADDRLAVSRERDVAQFDAADQRSRQPADAERGREVLVRLPNDERA